jgi:autotransporter-associated beta strand protein
MLFSGGGMRRKCIGWVGCAPILLGSADFALAQNALYSSSNWSGYFAEAPSGSDFTDAQATFVVPTVVASGTGTTYTSEWVGFDGVTDDTVEQCGISADVTHGGATDYFAWYEFAPQEAEQEVFSVNPNDTIEAETTYEGYNSSTNEYVYNFDIKDVTSGVSFDMNENTSSNDARSSVEWIAEAPTVGESIATLADFGSVTFSDDVAALNGGSDQSLGSLSPNEVEMIQNGYLAALPTSLNSAGNQFTVNYIPSVTWDNLHGTSPDNGETWDIGSSHNWNNGASNTVYTDGSNVTFNDSNNGHYTVTLNTTVNPSSVTFNNSAGAYTISGTGSIAGTGFLIKTGISTATLATANTYTGGTTVEEGTLQIAPTGSTTSALPNGPVTIDGGELLLEDNVTAGSQSANPPATAPTSNVKITSLSITGSGTLDIGNNHIIINYSGQADPISSIISWIDEGYDGGDWDGTGITSSDAASNSASYGIGYADAADPGNPAGLSAGQIEIEYTLLGDANLDGKVNGADFAILAANFNQSGKVWDQGDFNYTGEVNGSDFTLLANNFNQSASQSAVASADLQALDAFAAANGISLTGDANMTGGANISSVPEPMSAAIAAVAGLGLLYRRRRRRL